MSARFWKAVVRYGHLGIGKEISVARSICTKSDENIVDAYGIVENMPGVKASGVHCISEIDRSVYLNGKISEASNYYLCKLKSHNQRAAIKKEIRAA